MHLPVLGATVHGSYQRLFLAAMIYAAIPDNLYGSSGNDNDNSYNSSNKNKHDSNTNTYGSSNTSDNNYGSSGNNSSNTYGSSANNTSSTNNNTTSSSGERDMFDKGVSMLAKKAGYDIVSHGAFYPLREFLLTSLVG